MTEYTPGPWKLIWHGNERYPFPLSVHSADDANWIARDGTVSSRANARLIAAAPDLYEALKEAKAIIGCTVPSDWEGMNLPVPDTKSWDAALRKAEGKDND